MSSKIIENLYVGNASHSKFALNKYDLIVNCTKNIPDAQIDNWSTTDKHAVLIRIPIDDDKSDNDIIINHFDKIASIIHENLLANKRVLVHCQQGASRSVTIVAAYLIKYHKLTVEQVVKYMQSKRCEAFFCNHVVFKDALEKWEKACVKERGDFILNEFVSENIV